ncbi:GNAT family N-acetyltransferase [Salininema proteolyticum]|uniref:GNAT family N-acetyltransferase n=1 Tax=Salininema proteolyticum TaxID=1607685 RepID=A0ABV8U5N1_9ACTN
MSRGVRAEVPSFEFAVSPPLSDEELNELFTASWPGHSGTASFQPVLSRSLLWIAAVSGTELAAFVNVAWDGGVHAFLLDTTVRPAFRRTGLGTRVVRLAAQEAAEAGAAWLHVDYEPHLDGFYTGCGFRPTKAGLIDLGARPTTVAGERDRRLPPSGH